MAYTQLNVPFSFLMFSLVVFLFFYHEIETPNSGQISLAVSNNLSWSHQRLSMEMANWATKKKAPGYLLYIGDYTTQLYRDCKKPL